MGWLEDLLSIGGGIGGFLLGGPAGAAVGGGLGTLIGGFTSGKYDQKANSPDEQFKKDQAEYERLLKVLMPGTDEVNSQVEKLFGKADYTGLRQQANNELGGAGAALDALFGSQGISGGSVMDSRKSGVARDVLGQLAQSINNDKLQRGQAAQQQFQQLLNQRMALYQLMSQGKQAGAAAQGQQDAAWMTILGQLGAALLPRLIPGAQTGGTSGQSAYNSYDRYVGPGFGGATPNYRPIAPGMRPPPALG